MSKPVDSSIKLNSLLLKVPHFDKDERYMAILDIQNELLKDPRVDSVLEKKLCAAILDRIEQASCTLCVLLTFNERGSRFLYSTGHEQ